MRISVESNKAVHAIAYLGNIVCLGNNNKPALVRIKKMAIAIGTNPAFVLKIVQKLRKSGLVVTKAGRGGGVKLAPGRKITLYDILLAVGDRCVKCPETYLKVPKCRPCHAIQTLWIVAATQADRTVIADTTTEEERGE